MNIPHLHTIGIVLFCFGIIAESPSIAVCSVVQEQVIQKMRFRRNRCLRFCLMLMLAYFCSFGLVFIYGAWWISSSQDTVPDRQDSAIVIQMFGNENMKLIKESSINETSSTLDKFQQTTTLSKEDIRFNSTYGVYAYMGVRPFLWTLWDFSPMPPYIRLSIATMRCQNEPELFVAVLNVSTTEYILDKSFPPGFHELSPNHKGDIVRGELMLKFGGIWADADTLAVGPVFHQFNYLKDYQIIGADWRPDNDVITMGVLGPQRADLQLWKEVVDNNTRKMVEIEKIRNERNRTGDPFEWAELMGSQVLPRVNEQLKKGTLSLMNFNGAITYGQLVMKYLDRLFEPLRSNDHICLHEKVVIWPTPFLMFMNSGLSKSLKTMDMATFLEKKTFLGQLGLMSLSSCGTVNMYDLCA